MLRITVQRETKQTLLILEGRLAGAWVEELNKVLQALTVDSKNDRVTINLSAISGMDDAGKTLLSKSHELGAKLTGNGIAARAFVEEIVGGNASRGRNRNVRDPRLLL